MRNEKRSSQKLKVVDQNLSVNLPDVLDSFLAFTLIKSKSGTISEKLILKNQNFQSECNHGRK